MNLNRALDTLSLTESSGRYNAAASEINSNRIGSVLEVGPAGLGISPWLEDGGRVFYTDIIENFGRGDDVIRARASIDSLPYRDGSFSHVLCLDVLEHIPPEQRATAVDELYRVTKEDGKLMISSPVGENAANADSWLATQLEKTGTSPHKWVEEHQKFGIPSEEDYKEWFSQLSPIPKLITSKEDISIKTWQHALEVAAIPMGRFKKVVAMTRFIFSKFVSDSQDPTYRTIYYINK